MAYYQQGAIKCSLTIDSSSFTHETLLRTDSPLYRLSCSCSCIAALFLRWVVHPRNSTGWTVTALATFNKG